MRRYEDCMSSIHKLPKAAPPPTPPVADVPEVSLFDDLDARSVSLLVIAFGVTIFLLNYMQALLAPLAFGLLLFYALDPGVDALERRRVPRWIGAALMIFLTLGVIAGGAYALQDQALTVINQLPTGARRISQMMEPRSRQEPGPLDKVQQAAEELSRADTLKPKPGVVRVQVEEPRVTTTGMLWSGSVSVLGVLNQFLMILFLTYFGLLSDKMFRRKFVELGPTLTKKKITLEIIDDISTQIGRFLLVQIFTSVVVGVVTWAALAWIGLEQAVFWGLLAGVFNSIPYYGPLLVSGGLAVVAFLQFGTLYMTLVVAVVSLAITSLEGWLLTPTLMGKVASMNRVAVFVGLLFWSWAWGIWGLLLAVPIMMSIKVFCDHVEELEPVGKFLSE
jgi:predicted PurR-regulated permease PerM